MRQKIATLNEFNSGLQALYEANEGYYSGKPEMSDAEYDALVRELSAFRDAHPELKLEDPLLIGSCAADVPSDFGVTVWHERPMLSLLNVFEPVGVAEWFIKMYKKGADVIICEPKIDGISIKARYEDGDLVTLSTRGTGTDGTDITHCAGFILGVPSRLENAPYSVELRGEAYISDSDFAQIGKGFANSRNLVSGTIGSHNPFLCEQRKISAIFYEVMTENVGDTHHAGRNFMMENDVPVVPAINISIPSDYGVGSFSIDQLKAVAESAKELGLPIDGVVLKVNDLSIKQKLGNTAHHPRAAIAYKFAEQKATVVVKGVVWTIGRLGKLTPVAIFKPVFISGTSVSKVTCHNAAYVRDRGIGVGAEIVVYKSGGVIPKIDKVESMAPVALPTKCPYCDGDVWGSESATDIACANAECIGMLSARLEHFCSPKAMRIGGIGSVTAFNLITVGYITTGPKLMASTAEELCEAGLTKARANGVVSDVEKMRKRPDRIGRYIFALGIPSCGASRSYFLAEWLAKENGEVQKNELFMPFELAWLEAQYGDDWWKGLLFLQAV
jgi:DNA ligase (NAD+)